MKSGIFDHTKEIEFYLQTIRKFKLNDKDTEKELFFLYRQGDETAKKKIIMSNQKFVFQIAKNEYARNSDEILDYVMEGNRGLIKAIESFDETKGIKFISYAVWYIKQAMTNYKLNDGIAIRQTNNAKYGAAVKKIRANFFAQNFREPTIDEVQEILETEKGVKISDIRDIEIVSVSSINECYGEDGSFEDSKIFSDSSAVSNEYERTEEKEANADLAHRLLSTLDKRSADILMMTFGIGCEEAVCDEDIAEHFNLTATRIAQIRNDAIKKLRNSTIKLV